MLGGTRDAARQVDGGLHDLAGLAHLVGVGHPSGIHHRTGRTGRPFHQLGQGLDHLVLLGIAETTTTGHHDGGLVQLRAAALLDEPLLHRGRPGVAEIAHGDLNDLGRTAARFLGDERLGAHQEDGSTAVGEACRHVGGSTEHGLGTQQAVTIGDQVHDVGDDRTIDLGREATCHVTTVVGGGADHHVGTGTGLHGPGDRRGDAGTAERPFDRADSVDCGGAVGAQHPGHGSGVAGHDDLHRVGQLAGLGE